MSRGSRIALLAWAATKIMLLSAVIYQQLAVQQPFWQANERFHEAEKRGDIAGMRMAIADQRKAMCASLFGASTVKCP